MDENSLFESGFHEKFPKKIIIGAFATKGNGTNDERRLFTLASRISFSKLPFDKNRKFKSFFNLIRNIYKTKTRFVLMEGTGIFGGLALILSKIFLGVKYVISSGDSVGHYVGSRYPFLRIFFEFYEIILIRLSSGFVGWSPYLVGRALTFGAPRCMTAPGWCDITFDNLEVFPERIKIRKELGIPTDAIVVGIVGALNWNSRVKYCYGMEIVESFKDISRTDLYAIIVGGGSGLSQLESRINEKSKKFIKFVGTVSSSKVFSYLSAMDFATLPQSVDGVGNFRYTTKISEYIAAKLPIVINQTPFSYDFRSDWFWRLPGESPWDQKYLDGLSEIFKNIKIEDIHNKSKKIPLNLKEFDKEIQIQTFTEFCYDIIANEN